MNTSKLSPIPQRVAPRGTISTEEIKARIETMFADSPAPDHIESVQRRKARMATTASKPERHG